MTAVSPSGIVPPSGHGLVARLRGSKPLRHTTTLALEIEHIESPMRAQHWTPAGSPAGLHGLSTPSCFCWGVPAYCTSSTVHETELGSTTTPFCGVGMGAV